ncbi:hypothetical protein [Streptomyces sp. NPDC047525]|uniref:hypothetical protein n=1 Tax=Streptomyces sp. NPDC047525 TaxID=3155264 RepID=UPI0033D449B3
MAFLFLIPLLGVDGPSGTALASVTASATSSATEDRVGGRGCHEGQNRTPREALPAPERTTSPAFGAAPASYEPRDDVPALPGASPPDATSVDLYRTQVIRT